MKNTTYEIRAYRATGAWIEGTINDLHFQAKIYDEDSIHGINDGRVIKLCVWDEAKRNESGLSAATIINYERGWDVEPKTAADRHMLDAVIAYFENFRIAA